MAAVTTALVLLVLAGTKAHGWRRNATVDGSIQMTSMISGKNICSINGQRYFGPDSPASLEFRAHGFNGEHCHFILDTSIQYPYIVLYMDTSLADDEETDVTGRGFKIEFDDDSSRYECAYFQGPVKIDYKNKRGRGNLHMHVIWSQGKCCATGGSMRCLMRRCTHMSNELVGEIILEKRFWMSKRFISGNCKRGMASGFVALLIMAVLVMLAAMTAAFIIMKRKSSKRSTSQLMTPERRRSSGESRYRPPSLSSIPPPYSRVKALVATGLPKSADDDQAEKDSKTKEDYSEEQNPYSFI